jgi:hypothetical protein
MSWSEFWEVASYVVTVFGFPLALLVFFIEQRKERQNEDEEIFQKLADEYADFSKLLLENSDLMLFSTASHVVSLTLEQQERKKIIFDLLVSLFERAYILVYEEKMSKQTQRLWRTWEDYIRFWCKREDFRRELPELLKGEDPDFEAYMLDVSQRSMA